MAVFPDWGEYLRSVVAHSYGKGERQYVATDAIGTEKLKPESGSAGWNMPFQFELMVQTVERQEQREPGGQEEQEELKEQKKQIERFPVLKGIRKYAAGHVLLSGRPGSGKSTALIRLLLEEAQQIFAALNSLDGQIAILCTGASQCSPPQSPIPLLLELRLWENSILDRILKTLHKHDPSLAIDHSTLMDLLRQGRFLLLMDGLNELPSEAARQDVLRFRADYPQTPMIFTTRELSAGGDFGITKKLEMQPLTETQMQQFVRTYLGEAQGEQLLKQLKERLRELGQTPLLLWMLCCLFQQTGTIPPNLGLVFRQFTQGYANLKRDIPAREESRRWWEMLLQRLAFAMMQGDDPQNRPTEFRVAISKAEAQQICEAALQTKVADPGDRSLECLQNLLKHHLIQENGNSIEFRHQLLQEYYAAEALLPLLPTLSDAKLKRDYLNYLKWTEPIALMLALVEQETQALRIVRSALEVDLMLGARLAGAVQPAFQKQTVGWIEALDVPMVLKVELLGETRSDVAVPRLVEAIDDPKFRVRRNAVRALVIIGSESAIPGLLKAIKDPDSGVRGSAAEALGKIGSEAAIPALLKAIEDPDWEVRQSAVEALGQIGSEAAILGLLKAIEEADADVRLNVIDALANIGSEAAVPSLLKAVEDPDDDIRQFAASALIQIGSEAAVPGLLKAIENPNNDIRDVAVMALAGINEEMVPDQLKVVAEEPFDSYEKADERLNSEPNDELKLAQTTFELLKMIKDADYVCLDTINELIENIDETIVPELLKLIKDSDPYVRRRAVHTLAQIDSAVTAPILLKAITDPDACVRSIAVRGLTQVSDEVVLGVLKTLKDPDNDVRQSARESLFQIADILRFSEDMVLENSDDTLYWKGTKKLLGNNSVISALLKALEHTDFHVRYSAVTILARKLSGDVSDIAIPGLLKAAVDDPSPGMRWWAAKTLGAISKPQLLVELWQKQLESPADSIAQAITTIQNRCKFYNYELFQSEAIQESPPQGKSSITMNFYAPVDVATGNVEGNFINSAGKDPDQEVNP